MSTREQTRGRIEGFHVGQRIARRDVRRWSQKTLAERATEVAKRSNPDASVSVGMIGMIESQERKPSLEMAGWIAEALGYTIEDLGLLRPEAARPEAVA